MASVVEKRLGKCGVIVGAGIVGLSAAAAVAPFFDEVIILEKDELPSTARHRRLSGRCDDRFWPNFTVNSAWTLRQLLGGHTEVPAGRRSTALRATEGWLGASVRRPSSGDVQRMP